MKWQCHLIHSVPLLSLCSPLSSLILPFLFLSLSLSHLSIFASVGTSNEQPPYSDWMMYEIIRWDESIQNSKDRKWKKRERRIKCRSGDTEMFWQAALKERGWGVLRMLACNNGSRSQFHWCLNPGTLPLGNCRTDLIPASSATLLLPVLVWRRQEDCAVPRVPPWEVCVRAWAKYSRGGSPRRPSVLERLRHELLLHPCFISLIKAAPKETGQFTDQTKCLSFKLSQGTYRALLACWSSLAEAERCWAKGDNLDFHNTEVILVIEVGTGDVWEPLQIYCLFLKWTQSRLQGLRSWNIQPLYSPFILSCTTQPSWLCIFYLAGDRLSLDYILWWTQLLLKIPLVTRQWTDALA